MVHLCPTIGGGGGSAANNWPVTSSASPALRGSPSSTDSTETTSWSPLTVGLSGSTSRAAIGNAIKHENGWSFYLLLVIRGNDCFKGPSKRRQLLPRLFEVRHSSPSPPQTGRKWVGIGPVPQVLAHPLTSHFSGVRGGTTTIPDWRPISFSSAEPGAGRVHVRTMAGSAGVGGTWLIIRRKDSSGK